mgnify:CR=1
MLSTCYTSFLGEFAIHRFWLISRLEAVESTQLFLALSRKPVYTKGRYDV